MRFHRSRKIKASLLLGLVMALLSVVVSTHVPTVGAANSGAPVVTVVYTDVVTLPNSEVPGIPGARFSSFDRVYGSTNGNWAITGDTDLPTTEDEVLIANNVVRAREGTPFSPLADTVSTIDTKLGINNAGEVVYAVNSSGATTADEFILSHDGVTNTIVAQEGNATGLPALPGTTWGITLESPAIAGDGTVGFSADGVVGVPTAQNDLLVLGSTVLAQAAVTVPTGQIGTETWENFNLDDFWVSANGTQWLVQGDLSGATTTDGVVVVNGGVVIQEGVILPGSGYPDTVSITNVNAHMTAGGQWYSRGSNNVSALDWVYGNGAVIAERGAPIYTGATEIFTDTEFAATFFTNVGNSLGDYVIGGVSNAPSNSNGILVYNNTTVIARENDPLDLNGNGTYDDNAFINTFGNDDAHLTDDGTFYFVATIRDDTGANIGDGFFSMDLSGGGTPTPTATGTVTSTAVPSTNTPTATGTNTPVPPTATATVSPTPGSGNRVCSTVPIPIPDNLPGGATGTVNVALVGNVTDLNVILTGTHSWVGDIAANISNGSTNVTFFDRPGVPASTFGCSGDNLPGVFGDDEGADGSFENSCLNATPAYTPGGHYTPNNPLSAFDGQPAAGTWTLTVSDNAGGDTGTIIGWCVEFETGPGPTATPTNPPTVPDINVTPASFEETHSSPPQTTNAVMNIQNVGTGTLNWTIAEDDFAAPVDITDKVVPAPRDARLTAASAGVVQARFLQSGAMAPSRGTINLVLDDGLNENSIGLTAGGQFLWFNRFTPAPGDFPFTLTEIQFYTGVDSLCDPNDAVDFYVYQDADGNPANGATHIGSLTGQTIGTLEQFNSYPTNIAVSGPGDVLILAVNRGCVAPGGVQFPASLDQTSTQTRSWIGLGGTPGNPPTLPATTMGTIDSFGFPGNWMIRGVGQQSGGEACSVPTDIPWLTVSPTNGSTAGGGSTPVTLTFNSATLAQGTYTGTLCIESNDPDEALVTVPVTLNVGPPTAIDLSTFTAPVSGINPADLAAAGLLLLAGAVLIFRRK